MKKISAIIFVFLSLVLQLAAQTTSVKKNTLYLEFGGNGGIASMNYERAVLEDTYVRVGLSFMIIGGSSNSGSHSDTFIIPMLMAEHLFRFGSETSSLELGAGLSALGAPPIALSCGYRYCPIDGGFIFRIAVTPIFTVSDGVFPWAGISVGYAF
jgi:hypothetical protein